MGTPQETARLRELERRAFARPRSDADRDDAAAAAVELAALQAAASERATRDIAPDARHAGTRGVDHRDPVARAFDNSDADDGAEYDDEVDDRPTLGERAVDAARALLRRARALQPRTVRIAGAVALGAGALAAGGFAVHAALTAPPPAFAVFADGPVRPAAGDGLAFAQTLDEQGTVVLRGPHLFGEQEDALRVAVYREWLDADRTEVCASLVIDNAWGVQTGCTTEEDFRRNGVLAEFVQEGILVEFGWMPDGDVVLESELSGALSMEDVRALELPAVAALDAAGVDADLARELMPWYPSVLAGPVALGTEDRWQFFGVIVETQAAPWEAAERPLICLTARDDRTRVNGAGVTVSCAPIERFADEGLSLQTEDGLTGQWDAANVFDAELP